MIKEGVPGFFTGLKVSLIRDVPFSGMFYPLYNFFKDYYAILLNVGMENEKTN